MKTLQKPEPEYHSKETPQTLPEIPSSENEHNPEILTLESNQVEEKIMQWFKNQRIFPGIPEDFQIRERERKKVCIVSFGLKEEGLSKLQERRKMKIGIWV